MNLSGAMIREKSKIKFRLLLLGIGFELLVIIYFALPLILQTPVAIIVIRSNSMLPQFGKGNIVIIKGINKKLNSFVNKTIAFYDPTRGKIIVHRAISIKDNSLITKGDNADAIDFFQPTKEYILGKVVMKVR